MECLMICEYVSPDSSYAVLQNRSVFPGDAESNTHGIAIGFPFASKLEVGQYYIFSLKKERGEFLGKSNSEGFSLI